MGRSIDGACEMPADRFAAQPRVWPPSLREVSSVSETEGVMRQRRMSLTELSGEVGITLANLSNLKTGKAKAIRFTTLAALGKALDCQPGDILEFVDDS